MSRSEFCAASGNARKDIANTNTTVMAAHESPPQSTATLVRLKRLIVTPEAELMKAGGNARWGRRSTHGSWDEGIVARAKEADLSLFFAWYNFSREHQMLRTTPPVAAGVASEPWTLERLLSESAKGMAA